MGHKIVNRVVKSFNIIGESTKSKKARIPNRQGNEYGDATQDYVLQYYKVQSLKMLNREFLDNGFDRFVNLCVEWVILMVLKIGF